MHDRRARRCCSCEALGRHARKMEGVLGKRSRELARLTSGSARRPRMRRRQFTSSHKSDSEHIARRKARCTAAGRRKRVGGATKGLPQRECYVNVLRDAMASSLDKCGVFSGTTVRASVRVGRWPETNWALGRDLRPGFARFRIP